MTRVGSQRHSKKKKKKYIYMILYRFFSECFGIPLSVQLQPMLHRPLAPYFLLAIDSVLKFIQLALEEALDLS